MYETFISSILINHYDRPEHIKKLKGLIKSTTKKIIFFDEKRLSNDSLFPTYEKEIDYKIGRIWILRFLKLWEQRNQKKSQNVHMDNKSKRTIILNEYLRQKKTVPPKIQTMTTVQLNQIIDQLIESDSHYTTKEIHFECINQLLNTYIPFNDLTYMSFTLRENWFSDIKFYRLIYFNLKDPFKISSSIPKKKFQDQLLTFENLYQISKSNSQTFNWNINTLQRINLVFNSYYPLEKPQIQFEIDSQYKYYFDLTKMDLKDQSNYEIKYMISVGEVIGKTQNPFTEDKNENIPVGKKGLILLYENSYDSPEKINQAFLHAIRSQVTQKIYEELVKIKEISEKIDFLLGQLDEKETIEYKMYKDDSFSMILTLYGKRNEYEKERKERLKRQKEQEHWKQMIKAIDEKNVEKIKRLLPIEEKDQSILTYAIESGQCDVQIIKILLEGGADATYEDNYHSTLLHRLYVNGGCSQETTRKIAHLLLQYGADPYQLDRENRCFMLFYINESEEKQELEEEIQQIKKTNF